MTKGSTSPKKNERYSKVFQNDDEVDEANMAQFQKALSMPINFTKACEPHSAVDMANLDQLLSDIKIDEIDEDAKSVDDDSSSCSPSPSQKPMEVKLNKQVSEKKDKKLKRQAFFVHKAQSFKKTCESRSKSPVKNIIQNIQSSTRKIKFMKMNSIAFKNQSDSKMSERYSVFSKKNSVSSSDENEDQGFKFSSSKNLERTIISPIR